MMQSDRWVFDFILVTAALFLHSVAANFYFLFPSYIDDLGGDLFLVGVVAGASSVGAVFARPVAGLSIDRLGRRHVLIGGGVLHAASLAAMLLVTEIATPMVAVRLLQGFAFAATTTGLLVYASDVLPERSRLIGMSYFTLAGMASIGVSSQIGAWLIAEGGFRAVMALSVGFAVAGLLATMPLSETRHEIDGTKGGIVAQLKAPVLRPVWVLTLSFAIAISATFTFAEPYFRSAPGIGVQSFFTAYTVAAILVRLSITWASRRLSVTFILFASLAMLSLGLALLAADPRLGLVAGGCIGLAHGFVTPVLNTVLIQRSDRTARGASAAVYVGLIDLSPFLVGPLLGALSDVLTLRGVFAISAVFPIIGIAAARSLPNSDPLPDPNVMKGTS